MATLLCGAILGLAACGGGGMAKQLAAAPPQKVCGQIAVPGGPGAILTDASRATTIRSVTTGGVLLLRLTSSCDHGRDYTISPSTAATVLDSIAAKDGKPVFIRVQPHASAFTIDVGSGSQAYVVTVNLP